MFSMIDISVCWSYEKGLRHAIHSICDRALTTASESPAPVLAHKVSGTYLSRVFIHVFYLLASNNDSLSIWLILILLISELE